jgi:hypothetical protein
MPEIDKRNQNKGERHKWAIIMAVSGVILVGIFLIIVFLIFHGNLKSRAPFKTLNYPDRPTHFVAVSRHSFRPFNPPKPAKMRGIPATAGLDC